MLLFYFVNVIIKILFKLNVIILIIIIIFIIIIVV